MKPELENKLCEEFPTFFLRGKPLTESLMAFGFECGDGWYDLLHSLCVDIKKILTQHPELVGFKVIQVKEKFGGLRFYISGGSDEIWKRIDQAEKQSLCTCEKCGKPGKLRGRVWLYTACLDHTSEVDKQ